MTWSFVYFIEATGLDRVKVGVARDPRKRLAELQVGSAVELRLIKAVPGDREIEYELHRRWREHRTIGEWFVLAAIAKDIEAWGASAIPVAKYHACNECGRPSEVPTEQCALCAASQRRREAAERRRLQNPTRSHAPRCEDCGVKTSSKLMLCRACKSVREQLRPCLECGLGGLANGNKRHAECRAARRAAKETCDVGR